MNIGLYFGSFNPVHIGHMAIANYMVEFSNLTELWFIVSPQNPLKEKKTLLPDYLRLELLNLAIDDDPRFRASDIEFSLPKPSYTINTLSYLKEKFPDKNYYLIMGADNYTSLNKWKNYKEILNNNHLLIYPRPQYPIKKENLPDNVSLLEAPIMEISSSFIRNAIKNNKNIKYYLPGKVHQYITDNNLFKK